VYKKFRFLNNILRLVLHSRDVLFSSDFLFMERMVVLEIGDPGSAPDSSTSREHKYNSGPHGFPMLSTLIVTVCTINGK
jgi:hypothetical protein